MRVGLGSPRPLAAPSSADAPRFAHGAVRSPNEARAASTPPGISVADSGCVLAPPWGVETTTARLGVRLVVGVDHARQNEIAEAKLRTARKGGALLAETVEPKRGRFDSRDASRKLPDGFSYSMSSRWQTLASIPDYRRHVAADASGREHAAVRGVPLEVIAERLDCSPSRVAGLLADLRGVQVDERAGAARIVDVELAVAIRDACSGQTEPRALRDMGAGPMYRRLR